VLAALLLAPAAAPIRPDAERLSDRLLRAMPGARINVVPVGDRSVVLVGHVQRQEDVSVALAVAEGSGLEVINALRPAGVPQIELDVVLVEVPCGWVSLDACPARYAKRFGGNGVAQLLAAAKPAADLFGTTVPGWVKNAARVLWSAGQSTRASQEHLEGILDCEQDRAFVAFLESLEQTKRARIVSRPQLAALSGQPASFLVGGEAAVPAPVFLGSVGVQFEEFGTRLNFLPILLGNGRIHLEVESEVSTLDPDSALCVAGSTVAGRAIQRTKKSAELEPGQSLVLGGRGWVVLVTPRLLTPDADDPIMPAPPTSARVGGGPIGREDLLREIRSRLPAGK
jgi:pilus assembly protein CpaC